MNDQTQHGEIQTLPQVQDQETQMMQNLFQRAADTIVNASKLGKEVNELQEKMRKLLADTDRMREHIQWLEQENQTLRTQRDEAQNSLSDTKHELDAAIKRYNNLEFINNNLTINLESARTDANFWESEAAKTEASLREATARAFNLQNMLESIWGNIKDHFTPKPEPTPEIAPSPSASHTIYSDDKPNEATRPVDYWNNPNQHPAE